MAGVIASYCFKYEKEFYMRIKERNKIIVKRTGCLNNL